MQDSWHTHLELKLLHLPIQVLCQILPRGGLHLIHCHLSPTLEAIAVLREGSLDEVDARIEECLNGVCPTNTRNELTCTRYIRYRIALTEQRESTGPISHLVLSYEAFK